MIDFMGLLMSREFAEDRYPVYDMIRNEGRVLWVDQGMGRWLVTGHSQIQEVLKRHDKFSSDRTLWEGYRGAPGDKKLGLILTMDPPEHTRIRTPVQQVLTPRGVQRYRPMVEKIVDEMLTDAAERGEIDLMTDFADPLPLRVLAEMIGVPPENREFFKHFATLAVANLDTVAHSITEQSDEVKQARAGVIQIFDELIAQRREQPMDDLISKMLQAESAEDPLTSREVRQLCMGMFGAGLEPSTFLIGNAIHALFQHPDQAERMRSEPELLGPGESGGTALEEFLRYDSPAHLGGRVVREDVELDGHKMRKGHMVAVNIGAGNRDPEAFEEPGTLRLDRSPNPHLAFGYGIHRCLGAPVARLVGSVAIPALVRRFPALSPAGEARRQPNPHVQGFTSLPVALN